MKRLIPLPLIILLFFTCAKQTSPTGGPKDTIPPDLIRSNPKKEQTQFKGKVVELTFNEAIQLDNPKEQIIIIPDIAKEYEITSRKNSVKLTFNQDLQDTTTYSVNFRDAVKDLTEKNPAENLKLAFSTGPFVDSLSIRGSVSQLLQNKLTKDITIALYKSDTFNIFKHKPTYLTKSDKNGNYILENLKTGVYYLYAFDDKNKNLIVDSKTESYGFLKDSVVLHHNIIQYNIPLIKLDARPLKLSSKRPYNTYFNIKTSKGLLTYTLKVNGKETQSVFGEDRNNIKVYNTFSDADSVLATFHAQDSIDNKLDTAFYIKFSPRESKPEAFTVQKEHLRLLQRKALLEATFAFNKPLKNITFDSLYYDLDSLHRINFSIDDFAWDSIQNKLTLSKKLDQSLFPTENPEAPNKPTNARQKGRPFQPTLVFGKGAFTSIENDSTKHSQDALYPTKFEATGIFFITVETKEPSFIIQLLDKNFTVLQSVANTKKFQFEDLNPGEYQIRMIIDKNNDQNWSPGNFYKRIEPEPLIFYKGEEKNQIQNLKANFELELLITY